MRFRTEIERQPQSLKIDHSTPLLLLGSCFTDEVGSRLERDGFDVMRNPFGPLYNPASIGRCISRALERRLYTTADLTEGPHGLHCLDYASRYSGNDTEALLQQINNTLESVSDMLSRRPIVILTLGSSYVFELKDTGRIVGNCHKFPSDRFTRRRLTTDECARILEGTVTKLHDAGIDDVILTVSPIRHLADGLHGNVLSKSTLQLAADSITGSRCHYFPSYEIMLDDLRDYRFYASDMKHPSEVAVDYIYEVFSEYYFTKSTVAAAREARSRALAAQHRPIL
ncbi:MAG: GSCFA domain-containing protein [Muribaculaceae bacterium]|nr:GSCFA domain-containing protein [Muribaculaceae bacterium]